MTKDDKEAIAPASFQLKEINEKGGAGDAEEEDQGEPTQLKVYRRRWLMLAVVALLNNSNTMTWISLAPVDNFANGFYGEGAATWFSMVYMMMTIPVGIFSMWAGRFFGTKTAIYVAAITNCLGTAIRLSSSFVPINLRFPIGITGQAIAAIAYPFIMYLPSKVANSWFPHNQRALAVTVGAMSNPLGVLMANVIVPALVKQVDDIAYANILVFVPCLFGLALVFGGVRTGEPKIPPSFSASQEQMDFVSGLKQCFLSKQYMILFLVMGGGIGMFNCLYTIMQKLLCPSGYDNQFAGLCAALMIIGGLIGATGSSIVIDRTKMYEETMKVALGLAVVFGLIFMQLSLHDGLGLLIAVCCFLFGVLGLATYPVGLELSVECTHPVSEATATGLIVLSGQIQSVIYVTLMEKLRKCTLSADDTRNVPTDNTIAVMAFSIIAALLVIILVFFFKPVYKRLEAEKANRALAEKREEQAKKDKGLPSLDNVTQPLNA
ncbi:hypothetical protein PRIPAC_72025 [Pristionchus pacificus]|uniref:Membrane transporter n=1 Tax=Pristionchus pacificus TaxID=54126 RepID=A0A454XMT8_PRIPA|nr:hypothetical protein PRIPAC_72025 [Pristionchus pacificus]|eukprot:PDM83745.1 membrane transporter [Pristionchus pacificus]